VDHHRSERYHVATEETIFRVANGKIAEHWDVMQEEVPAEKSANGNSMFTTPQA